MVVVLTKCINDVSVIIKQVHLIVGAVSLWTRPPALYLCTGNQKNPNSPPEHCNCATVAVDCTQNHQTNVAAQARVREAATVGARLSSPRVHSTFLDHLISVLQLKKLHGKTKGICICVTTGMSTTSGNNDFLNVQELWESNCLIHNLHVRTCKTAQQGHRPLRQATVVSL